MWGYDFSEFPRAGTSALAILDLVFSRKCAVRELAVRRVDLTPLPSRGVGQGASAGIRMIVVAHDFGEPVDAPSRPSRHRSLSSCDRSPRPDHHYHAAHCGRTLKSAKAEGL